MLSVNCPKCNATNIFDETKNVPTYCSFCGAHLPDMTDYVRRSLNLAIDRQYDDLDEHRTNREIRRERTRNVGSWLQTISLLIKFIVTIPLIIMLLYMVFKIL